LADCKGQGEKKSAGHSPYFVIAYHLHITGQVQGVGFRPFVYQTALNMGVNGWVNNGLDGVHVVFEAEAGTANQFVQHLLNQAPSRAIIRKYHWEEVPLNHFEDFQIRASQGAGSVDLVLSPDFAMCEACRQELHDPANHRYQYPFITCTQCGPRYSIISALPYDRERTSMSPFEMCESCLTEYQDPLDKRHHSQTNSCPDCPISLQLYHHAKEVYFDTPELMIQQLCQGLAAGEIIAVKGIGGCLLLCDATNPVAIERLRKRKHRPTKPLALMYPNLEVLEGDVVLDAQSAELLQGPVAPIVLLPLKPNPRSEICHTDLAPGWTK
jgi:hydrogenase maturation protein HypF